MSFSSPPQSVVLGQGHSQRSRLSPSFSMPDINDTFGSIWSPNLLSGSLNEHVQTHHPKVTTFVTAFNALRVQFSYLKHRIYGMETENNELRHANMVLRSDSQALEQELSNFRADYYTERFQSKVRVQCARADKEKIIILTDRLEQAEKFIMAMVDIKLHEAVLGRAAKAVKEGADAEEALIDAVRMAATKKGSAWSRIIPAIVGPRSPEHYLSAIKLALMLQKDLHESEKVSSFWKTIAKLDPVNADIITPSPSLLSEVGGQDVEHSISEQAVLDEMIALLTNGETLSRKTEVVQPAVAYFTDIVDLVVAEDESIPIVDSPTIQPELALSAKLVSPVSPPSGLPNSPLTKVRNIEVMPPTKAPQTAKTSGISPSMHSQIPISPLRSKAPQIGHLKLPSPISPSKILSSISPAKQPSPSRISSKQPATPSRKAPLPPIRSRLSTPRTNTFRRPALSSIDINRPPVKMNTSKIARKRITSTDDTIRKTPTVTRDRSRTLVKRRGVIMEGISHPPPSIVAKSENIVLPMTAEIEIYEPRAPPSPICVAQITKANNLASTSISTKDIPSTVPVSKESSLHCSEFDLSSENVTHGSSLATQALLSLERICAAFSSDSLGSLEMSNEGSDYESDFEDLLSTNRPNSSVVSHASLTNLTHICKAVLDLERSMASDSGFREDLNLVVDEDPQVSDSPRPPTPIVKCSTWACSTPRQPISSSSTASSFFSSSVSLSISFLRNKEPCKANESPTPARTPISASKPSPTYPTDKLAKSVKDTFYKAVPPSQTISLLPIKQNLNNGFRQPLAPPQNKISDSTSPNALDQEYASPGSSPPLYPCKPRSHTINVVSPLPPNLSTPLPETLSTAFPFKPRSNTVATTSRISLAYRKHQLERHNRQRSTSLPVDRPYTTKTISSFARRRSNTLDSYLRAPSNSAKGSARTKTVSCENDVTAPTAAFMRRPSVKTTPLNARRMTNCAAPLIPNGCPTLSGTLSGTATQYRNMLRGGVNMVVR